MQFRHLHPKALRRLAGTIRKHLRPTATSESLDLTYLHRLLGPSVSTILEIGANDGGDTMRLHRMFPAARLCVFEPDPRALALLRDHVAGTPIEVFASAIGDYDGATIFHQSGGVPPAQRQSDTDRTAADEGDWHRSGSIRRPTGHLVRYPWVTFDKEITVDIQRLDSWSAAHMVDSVDFIWADVQGAEIDLVKGGMATLARTRFLYTEFSNMALYDGQIGLDALLALLPDWRVERLFTNDVLLRNTTLPGSGHKTTA